MNTLPNSSSLPVNFTFSAPEFWLLLGIAGAKVVYGLADPFAGQPDAERPAAQQEALQSLIQRDCVRPVGENELALQATLADVMNTCTHPEYSLIIHTQATDGAFSRRVVYIADRLAIDCAESLSGNYRLTALPILPQFRELLHRTLNIAEDLQTSAAAIDLPESALNQARQACAAGQLSAGADILQSAGLTADNANRLGQALSTPAASTSVTLLAHPANADPRLEKSFATWQGRNEIWLLQPYVQGTETRVALKPVKPEALQTRLTGFFSES